MIPEVILAVPVFVLFNRLGLTSRLGLIIVYTALNLPFNIWVLRTFIMELPFELEESAIIDGCNDFTVFTRIVLPLIGPGLAVASIFTFRIAWNEFILSLVLTNRFTRTLPVAISMYLTDTGTEWGRITAIATIIAIPAFIFTFTAAKSLIMGLTAGAVKG
jgi:multiple sugar transport system permease protein